MLAIFALSFKTETKEAVFTGNIPARQAINILQDYLIADEVRRAKEAKDVKEVAKEIDKPVEKPAESQFVSEELLG
jgi:hypothetical protein